jgi:hypothetical protein
VGLDLTGILTAALEMAHSAGHAIDAAVPVAGRAGVA